MTTAATITQYFENVLLRSPTVAEIAVREALIANGSSTLEEICHAIVLSQESETYVHQMVRIYQTAFGRVPDINGIDGWVDALRDGTATSMDMINGFLNSREWQDAHGSSEVLPATIQSLYQNMLGRAASDQEISAWLATGDDLGEILLAVANSAEAMTLSEGPIIALLQRACDTANPAGVYNGQASLYDPLPDPVDPTGPDTGEPGNPGGPVDPVNGAPSVDLENEITELNENNEPGTRIKVADIVVADDGLGVNGLALSGDDAALFEIDGNELFLRASTALDFEGGNAQLDVTIEVDDTTVGATPDDTVDLTIQVQDENEAPEITGDETITVQHQENNPDLVVDVRSTDPDLNEFEGMGLTYSLTDFDGGGADNDWFTLDPDTGELHFITPPDRENPVDGTPNTGNDDGEGGEGAEGNGEGGEGEGEAEGGMMNRGLFLRNMDNGRPGDGGGENPGGGGEEMPELGVAENNVYEVQVTVSDEGGLTDTQNIYVTVLNQDEAPIIIAPTAADRLQIEAVEGQPLITTIEATDPDNTGLGFEFSLTDTGGAGPDSDLFTINNLGEIRYDGVLPFNEGEGDNTYNIVARAQDVSRGGPTLFDELALTITVTEEMGGGRDNLEPTLLAATGAAGGDVADLTKAELSPIVSAAMARWADAGLSEGQLEVLSGLNVVVMDLHDDLLGLADSSTIIIDSNAAGHGWFIDQTPADDVEFAEGGPDGMDLLTTVLHEMGHSLGLADQTEDPSDLMYAWLDNGERRLPDAADVALTGQQVDFAEV